MYARVEPLIESFYASTISPTVPAGRACNHKAVSRPRLRVSRYNWNLGQQARLNEKVQSLADDDSACLPRRHSDPHCHVDRPTNLFGSGQADWCRTPLIDPNLSPLGSNLLCH